MPQVLVIDDNDQLRDVIKETLSRAGYETLVASDGKEGVDLYRKEKPDLIITDIIMPEKGGPEVIFELQKEFPDIKIIAMSGGGRISGQEYLDSIAMFSDLKYTFEKPFAMNDLLKAVKDLVG